MNPAVVVRDARPGDLDAMAGLLTELFSIEQDFEPDSPRQLRGLSLLLESPQAKLLVAEADARVVGMFTAQRLISTAEGGPVALLEDMIVTRDWRGRGIGRLLLDAMEQWAAEEGLTRMQLLADLDNTPALDFYRARGWQPTRLAAWRRRSFTEKEN